MEFSEQTRAWFDALTQFVDRRRSTNPAPTAEQLDRLEDEQRRVAGGSLMQFLQFLQSEAAFEAFPVLEEHPIAERVFVFASDAPGVVAARDIVDWESDRAIVVTKQEWRAFLEDPSTDSDRQFDHHYEHWNVWHQDFRADWDLPDEEFGELWIHEEGFAVGDRAGRGSRHLWGWDGSELELVEQEVDQWASGGESRGE